MQRKCRKEKDKNFCLDETKRKMARYCLCCCHITRLKEPLICHQAAIALFTLLTYSVFHDGLSSYGLITI